MASAYVVFIKGDRWGDPGRGPILRSSGTGLRLPGVQHPGELAPQGFESFRDEFDECSGAPWQETPTW